MRILGTNEGHDGAYALLDGSSLEFSLEGEKDSFPRCSPVHADLLLRASGLCGAAPDLVAVSGWSSPTTLKTQPLLSGYTGSGPEAIRIHERVMFGQQTTLFSTSHERSHIWCAYGLSPFVEGSAVHVLVWEGRIGGFYRIEPDLSVTELGSPLSDPGNRYSFIYALADPESPSQPGYYDVGHPGKVMALAAFSEPHQPDGDEAELIEAIVKVPGFLVRKMQKDDFAWSPFHNIGVESDRFRSLARGLTDRIFSDFLRYAESELQPGLPLAVAGGCGLNCEWNSAWRMSGLFSEVFVPPCTNDSGSAIGAAIDALRHFSGHAKVDWTVYAGEEFAWDTTAEEAGLVPVGCNDGNDAIMAALNQGEVLAWVEGRYEIGPRALGHRSLVADATRESSHHRLNDIKARESYRPIAPVCLEEDATRYFEPSSPSPHMLYFGLVTDQSLPAVTHVDGSARLQTLTGAAAPLLQNLLRELRSAGRTPVLCNTSLNFKGHGFINRLSDLGSYVLGNGVDGAVIDGALYRPNRRVG